MSSDDDNDGASDVSMEPQVQTLDKIVVPTLRQLGTHHSEYWAFPKESRVERCIREVTKEGDLWYLTAFADGHTDLIPFEQLMAFDGGAQALEGLYTDGGGASTRTTNSRHKARTVQEISSGDDDSEEITSVKSTLQSEREARRRKFAHLAQTRRAAGLEAPQLESSEDELQSPQEGPATRRTRSQPIKRAAMLPYKGQHNGTGYDSDDDLVVSDLVYTKPKKHRSSRGTRASSRNKRKYSSRYDSSFSEEEAHTRKSGRTTTKRNTYAEPGLDDDFMDVDTRPEKPSKPRIVHAKEIFPTLDDDTPFVQYHNDYCETCGGIGNSKNRGALIYCQGCSYAYHTECIGSRAARDHLVTKIADDDFVLQCKRCIGRPHRKDYTAPHCDRCTDCRCPGASCEPFRPLVKRKLGPATSDGSTTVTPDVEVAQDLLYNPDTLLFRCVSCHRAWHWKHLPPRDTEHRRNIRNVTVAEQRLAEYADDFRCNDCDTHTEKIHVIRAWRPADPALRVDPDHLRIEDFCEDDREYLIKFADQSYFRAEWKPGAWVWGVAQQMRTAFLKKSMLAFTVEDAVPESYKRIEIVFDVRYTSIVPTGEDMDVDLKRIGEVSEALVKWEGLGYEDVVWEVPPEEDGEGEEGERVKERYKDWKKAYEGWVKGMYVHLPRGAAKRQVAVRAKRFAGLEKEGQPGYVVGGTLMKYQMDGMNWLYYKWHQGQTSILADEMGLGKTIQIISFLSILVNDHNLYPFLIIVPHSTVPNWKREIETWAPSMRVVAYYGADKARSLSRKYEMFHQGSKNLKCHIVVTSYSTPITDSKYLKNIPWEALIVDEGQRLKNDQSLLYKALEGYKIKHKVLMTGTPLQNNPRELFNLLQFLDSGMDAGQLEEEFGELTTENVKRLHEMIRPFFLRRTKKEVLTFLPPMAEVIVPVTMSSLQRKLYKSILAKDPSLIKSIFKNPGDKSKAGNLKNVLMQLRKVLGHPFFYSEAIEDRNFPPETLHRNLIEAGSKFELLNIMLPKLKERGHRVLMFSQFLGMLDVMEDFLLGLGMQYQRLDGSTNTQEKQRRIDAFNAPGSEDFAFLLSTRAGGVGINLATADTVIILDPDFNPHQDIQALSRAHRIGQKNKVLVFHLVTRDTAEEKIMQIGKKKLSLDHLIIEKMGVEGEEEEQVDVESVLKFGARALFEDGDDAEERRIKYDSDGVDRLLDRSTIEETKTTEVAGTENAFSFARVWANDKGSLEEGLLGGDDTSEGDMDTGFWDKLLAEREELARKAAAAAAQELGRGKRRKKVDYSLAVDELDLSPQVTRTTKGVGSGDDDDEFKAEEEGPESESDVDMGDGLDVMDLGLQQKIAKATGETYKEPWGTGKQRATSGVSMPWKPHPTGQVAPVAPLCIPAQAPQKSKRPLPAPKPESKRATDRSFHRVDITPFRDVPGATYKCKVCQKLHPPGQCSLKTMGVELCPLCGIAHYGKGTTCPHFRDEAKLQAMLEALRYSKEDPQMVRLAKSYVNGRKGAVRQALKGRGLGESKGSGVNG